MKEVDYSRFIARGRECGICKNPWHGESLVCNQCYTFFSSPITPVQETPKTCRAYKCDNPVIYKSLCYYHFQQLRKDERVEILDEVEIEERPTKSNLQERANKLKAWIKAMRASGEFDENGE